MIKEITTSNPHIRTHKPLQPHPQTLNTILAFATAYHAEPLTDGTLLQSIIN